jgi:hypothetical protein
VGKNWGPIQQNLKYIGHPPSKIFFKFCHFLAKKLAQKLAVV